MQARSIYSNFFTILAMVAVIAAGFVYYKQQQVTDSIKGTVTNVVDRPNVADDRYYGFELLSDSGRKYNVNATGFQNASVTPANSGETCVYVPQVKLGDRVEFRLPESKDQPNTFDVCYPQGQSGYYFKLN